MRGEGYSLADIRAVTEGNNNGGFGDGYGIWWILIIIILFGGWGRGFGGYGGGNGDTSSIPYFQSLDTDFATIERKLDTVNAGICDATYALNNTVTNGFAAAQNTMTQGFAGLNTGMVQQGYENRIAVNGVGTQLMQCCCDLRQQISDVGCSTNRNIDQVRYDNSQNTNMLNNTINNGFTNVQQSMCLNTRDIIDNQNANYRALHDEIIANRLEDKNAQITAQQNEINSLRLAASQSAQNEYLLNSLRNGCPVNAQLVCGNQPIPVQYITAGCGCGSNYNNGCGC